MDTGLRGPVGAAVGGAQNRAVVSDHPALATVQEKEVVQGDCHAGVLIVPGDAAIARIDDGAYGLAGCLAPVWIANGPSVVVINQDHSVQVARVFAELRHDGR